MKTTKRKSIVKKLDTIQTLLQKCGGEGGTPGPCPSGKTKPVVGNKIVNKISESLSRASKVLTKLSKSAISKFDKRYPKVTGFKRTIEKREMKLRDLRDRYLKAKQQWVFKSKKTPDEISRLEAQIEAEIKALDKDVEELESLLNDKEGK